MTSDQLNELASKLDRIDTDARRARYLARRFPGGSACRDLTARYRRDVLAAVRLRPDCAPTAREVARLVPALRVEVMP